MDWVKLPTDYYLDPAVMRAGEEAEVLFLRGFAYAGDQETDGFVPEEVVDRLTPKRARTRAAALVREHLWEVVTGGWQIIRWWGGLQETTEALEASRAGARARQARSRAKRQKDASRRESRVTHTSVTVAEGEGEVEPAAAAAERAAAAPEANGYPPLPVTLDILRTRMQAHQRLAALRFDTLSDTQITELERLIDLHGDTRLTTVAVDTCRSTPPVSVAAFIGTWAALPPPGQRLAVVRARCGIHETTLDDLGTCRSCAADAKAAR